MSVGEALAEARGAAGLSVDEVSERTAIREIVIRSIERDDFGSLGGDLYVRGYLRKIAGAVGIDPRPLIREFDATRSNGSSGWSAFGGPSSTATAPDPATVPVAAPDPATVPEVAQAVRGPAADSGEPEAGLGASGTGIGQAAVEAAATTAGDAGDSDAEPETAEEPDDWPDSGSDAWGEESTAEPAEAELQPGTAQVTVGEAGDTPVEQYWAEPSSARPAPSDPWADQGWTEPVAAEAVWADPVPLEPADRQAPESAIPSGTPATAGSSANRNAAASPVALAARSARRPRKPGRPRTRVRGWRWVITISGLTVVVLAVVTVAAVEIVSKVGSPNGSPGAAAASRSVPTAAPSVTAPPATPAAVKSTPASKPTPAPSPKPPAPAPPRRLAVQADGAFGPDGLGDGDNPQSASFAITPGASSPWQTHWYTTADFGLLKHGTGLLLDMGKPVTITSVKLQLGPDWGADLQLRAGDEADLSEMGVVASKTDAGGQLTMRPKKPARARYVLIWFVKLPPSGAGTYTASVSQVTVEGRP